MPDMHTGLRSASPTGLITSVVIVGGGYAGMIASNRLWASLTAAERARTRVTIINPTDLFVHRIRLHEHAAGVADATLPLRSMIHGEVDLLVGQARRIDVVARTVHVETPAGKVDLRFDKLIYAVGSRSSTHVPGVEEHAETIGDVEGAEAIAHRIASGHVRRICVVGGGPTGVETAAELAEAHPELRVTLLAGDRLVGGLRPAARRSIRRSLERLGVEILDGTRVTRVVPGGVTTSDGAERAFDLVVWAAGFEVPDLAARSGLPVDRYGRMLVDETLVCLTEPAILGAGDAVSPPDAVAAHLPMGARVALPLGGAAADTLLAALRRRNAETISIGLLGPSISLGRRDGYIQLAHPDDSPTPIAFTGRLGALIKSWVCWMTIDTPRKERTRPGAYRVPRAPRNSRSGRATERSEGGRHAAIHS